MKLANWNVAKPVSLERRKDMLQHLGKVSADLLVLTETHDGFNPGYQNTLASLPGLDGNAGKQHRWAAIWSNDRLEQIPTSDKQRTVAARVFTSGGDTFLVFATVLPWTGSDWQGHASKEGVAFAKALEMQKADWQNLRKDYPNEELFVMGDFNQDLVGSHYYGSAKNRAALELALQESGLISLTGGQNDPIAKYSPPCACIDHICMRSDSKWRLAETQRWPDEPKPPRSLSDHFGVSVVLK